MTQEIQFKFRLPATLKKQLEDAAKKGGRTLSAELVLRLERSFDQSLSNAEWLEGIGEPFGDPVPDAKGMLTRIVALRSITKRLNEDLKDFPVDELISAMRQVEGVKAINFSGRRGKKRSVKT